MSAAGEFIDATLQRESSWERADADRARLGGSLTFYGASVGAIRGTIRDAGRRYPGLGHDEITALSSELWAVPVYERRLAAVVLLQSHVRMLRASDLTRIEGFLRTAQLPALLDPLTADVVRPLVDALTGPARSRAQIVLDRWAQDPSAELRRAAGLLGVCGGAAQRQEY
ncbi:DNA alkylation repair protein [Cryobacterium sp. LW097]|uniref:DNA alkylation repair protein n=1 Tax=unclassified Cryobacterium TaxID=2649013 RepID=UPI000B4D581C|nr:MULTISPECIES: DNA alkylation repair protein [unclassified Cryobacterium]ASD21817.1 DNA alkylation repair protein [Cryobacterium sp. LW097]TFC86724.1 DNA alkylation repair protein [Cryobacterium sp. TMT4-31]